MQTTRACRFLLRLLCLATALGALHCSGAELQKPNPPNFLIAVADDWSWPHAGAYGCRWVSTPAFDRVASQGLLFQRAYTPNAKCAPSRSALLTGRNPWQLKAAANHISFFPLEFKSYAEALAERGYFVGMTTKGWGPGTATNAAGKPRHMLGRPFNSRTAAPPTSGIGRSDYAANFDTFLAAAPAGAPWCFWYGSIEPHRAYQFGSGTNLSRKTLADVDRVPACWPDNPTLRTDLLDYALEVEHFDRHLGRMLAALEQRGSLSNTIVVVTADNGMPFPRAKGQSYEISCHLPLAVMWPRQIAQPGRKIDDFVSLIDLAPTLLEAAGISQNTSGMAPITGQSLFPFFNASTSAAPRDFVLLGRERNDIGRPGDAGYPIRAIRKGDYLYLHNYETSRWPGGNPETGYLDCDGSPAKTEVLRSRLNPQTRTFWDWSFGKRSAEELYDIRKDPDCIRNLVGTAEFEGLRKSLASLMEAELRRQQDPRMLGQGDQFDRYPFAQESQRGFYERFMKGEKIETGWVNDSDFEKLPRE